MEVREFIKDFMRVSATTDQIAQRKVRDIFQVEVAGFSEFIAVNGKIYRYGFVSRDNRRTCALVRAMFDDNLHRFNEVVGLRLTTWDDLTAPKLKIHLRHNHEVVRALNESLPAPVVEVNDATRAWLKSVYENIARLNARCNTEFRHWDDVVITPDTRDAFGRETGRDIEDIRDMLAHATTLAMAVGADDWIQDLFNRLHPPPVDLPHGRVEILFATLASLEPACIETFYVMLLMFLAASTHTETLTVPTYTGEDTATERAEFLEEYYDTTTRSAHQEWVRVTGQSPHEPLHVLVKAIPASSVKNFNHFATLVAAISAKK